MVAIVIGTATVKVKADTKGFRGDLDGLVGHVRGKLSSLGGLIAGLGLGRLAQDAISFGATYRVQLDNASAAIHGLVTNQEDATDLMSRMTEMAIQTPFDLPGIQNATTRLLAYGDSFGVTSDNVLDWISTIGDAAASVGKGPDAMLNVVTAMGKIAGQGRIMTRDMNQLTANFPSLHPWELLAEMTGKTEQELRKLATKPGGLSGIVDTTEFLDQLKIKMEEMPGAAGAMERRMQTLGGTMELFKDAMGVALADGLQPFFAGLQGVMKDPATMAGLEEIIAKFAEFFSKIMTGLVPALPGLIDGISKMFDAVMPLAPAFGNLATIFGVLIQKAAPIIAVLAEIISWVTALLVKLDPDVLALIATALAALWLIGFGPVGWVTAAIIGLIALITALLHSMGVSWGDVMHGIADAWFWLVDQVFKPIGDFVMGIVHWFQHLQEVLVGHSIIPDLVNAIIEWFNKLTAPIAAVFNAIWTVIQFVWDGIKGTVQTALSVIGALISTYIATYKVAVQVGFEVIKTYVELVWLAIKTSIVTPIQVAKTLIEGIVKAIVAIVTGDFGSLKGIVAETWNGIKNAIVNPMQAAYDRVADLVGKIKNAVQGAIDKVASIPGAGVIGKIPGLAVGGIIDQPTLAVIGERGRREAVIPLTNPGRAMQLMQQSGLDRLAAQMGQSRGVNGPLVSMPGAVIQDATDADLVAQRTLVAMTAAMAA